MFLHTVSSRTVGLPESKLALCIVCHIENSQGFIQDFYWGEGGIEIRAKRAGMHQCQNYNYYMKCPSQYYWLMLTFTLIWNYNSN